MPSDAEEEHVKLEAMASEFIGTFFLVLTVGFNVLLNTALAPISIGLILMAMIFATGNVSGGHFNPAVTVGVLLQHKIGVERAVAYAASQMVGALVAGCVYVILLQASFALGPGVGFSASAAAMVEVLFTAGLVFVVLSVAYTAQDAGNWYGAMAVGFTVIAAAFAIGPISGCCLNPAVAFGVLFSHMVNTGHLKVGHLMLYTVCPLIGSAVAALFFSIIREGEHKAEYTKAAPLPVTVKPAIVQHYST